MTQQQIQQLFQLRYNQNNWKQFLSQAFIDARLLSSPDVLTGVNTDVATQVMRLGYIALNENGIERTIAIYDVTLAPGIILERNRVGLRNLLRKYWKDIDAAFIVYHRPENPNWRFTYVSELTGFDAEGELIKVKTEPKRYTYILGEGESCRTAAERFAIIAKKGNKTTLDDVKEAFSVEKLSKSFFDEYKKHYELFCDYMVSKPNIRQAIFSGDEKAIRDFNKKLLGRIVFLYFIQKKGWLGVPERSKWGQGDPNFLSNLFNNARNRGLFYSEYLARLFFDTLNTPRPNDLIELIKGEPVKIPFLNGGLFEEDNKIYRNLILPAELFENLFLFFNQYNFTIYEDDPNDHTVAVDPEMLGHIFENLLEDNKDKGAFYTPKEIVHYMCQESLIEYLKNSPPSEEWQTKSDGVVNSPPLEGWRTKSDGVVNSPPLEGWPQAGVVKRASKNYFDLPYNPKLKERARELRKAGNLSEVLFWNRVKNKGFRGFDFDRQKIIGNYIVDFFCTNCNVVIEIDGSSHDDKQEYDAERDRYLKKLGLKVIHIPVEDVMQDMDGVMEMLDDHPALKGTPPEEGNELPLATAEEGNELPLATAEEGNELPLAPPEDGNEPRLTSFLKGNWEENVIHLIKYKNPQNLNQHEIQQINDALDKVKICDPAIGSGAFPMGLLKEIFTAKQTLYIFEHGNAEGFDASGVKLNIIQNSIYGVDIEKGAVDIARLRFWLSLVVDEEAPKALPNLDYKIVVGNSLVSKLGDDIIDIDWNLNETSYGLFGVELATEKIELLKQITAKQKEFFNPQNSSPLERSPHQSVGVVNSPPLEGWPKAGVVNSPPLEGWPKAGVVKKKLATDIRKLKIDLLINQLELMVKTQGIETRPTGNGKATAKQTTRYLETLGWKQQIEKLKKLKNSPPKEGAGGGLDFFDWKLDFPEVLNPILVNDNGGFDIVIGNPPYGAKLNSTDKSIFQLKYETAKTIKGVQKGSLDTFTLFIELGHGLVNTGGNLHYIVPISVTSSDSMTGVHKLIESDCSVIKVSSYSVRPQPVFENAVVNTSILYFKKDCKPCERIFTTKMYRKNSELNLKHLVDNLEFIDVNDHKIRGRYPKISLEIEKEILSKIFANETKIGDLLKQKGQSIFYRTTGGRYFKIITNYSTASTKEKPIYFDERIANSIGALLSSNLFFWFYQIYSNNLDLKSYEIEVFGIPIKKFDDTVIEKLESVYAEYLKDIERNANVRLTEKYANIDSFKEYKIGKSKHLIDKIDDIIGPLYGLTEEEINFIKEYEIHYRLKDE
ncbi:MAG: DUF559 domain-containing protein [Bacteroidales bacterium]|nr:DUF559 domain-containing protein [Bacteroidales bacterium]